MFKSRILPIATLCLGLALILSSFDWSGEPSKIEPNLPRVSSHASPAAAVAVAVAAAPSPAEQRPLVPAGKPKRSDRGLRVGDRFPLVKTVEQRVTQQQAGDDVTVTSRLTVTLFLEVNEVVSPKTVGSAQHNRNPGDARLSVRYTRVRYEQGFPEQIIDYDSDNPPTPIPPKVRPYHALVGNGFSFWVDRNHQIRELVGFPDFIGSCLNTATPRQRAQVWKSLARTSSRDQIANFIDDSIGLLPPSAVKINDRWHRIWPITQPVPVTLSLQYTLEEINDETALIHIGGAAKPSPAAGTDAVKVEIHGGRLTGQCTIDRRTGLPIHSRVEQTIAMEVHLAGGKSFRQTKQTLTRIDAVSESPSARMSSPTASVGQSTKTR